MLCFVLALLFLLYHLRVGDAESKVDGGKVLCFFLGGDLGVVRAPPVAWASCLVGAVLLYGHPGKREW